MYTYNCQACRKDFNSLVSNMKIKYWICPTCINIYVKVDRYFKDMRKALKPKEYAIDSN